MKPRLWRQKPLKGLNQVQDLRVKLLLMVSEEILHLVIGICIVQLSPRPQGVLLVLVAGAERVINEIPEYSLFPMYVVM